MLRGAALRLLPAICVMAGRREGEGTVNRTARPACAMLRRLWADAPTQARVWMLVRGQWVCSRRRWASGSGTSWVDLSMFEMSNVTCGTLARRRSALAGGWSRRVPTIFQPLGGGGTMGSVLHGSDRTAPRVRADVNERPGHPTWGGRAVDISCAGERAARSARGWKRRSRGGRATRAPACGTARGAAGRRLAPSAA